MVEWPAGGPDERFYGWHRTTRFTRTPEKPIGFSARTACGLPRGDAKRRWTAVSKEALRGGAEGHVFTFLIGGRDEPCLLPGEGGWVDSQPVTDCDRFTETS